MTKSQHSRGNNNGISYPLWTTIAPMARKPMITASLLALAVLAGCDAGPMMGSNSINRPFTSNGERIYFTATSASGQRISSQGGGRQRMMGGGCASCHGEDRGGRRLMPKFWKTAPALTPAALFGATDQDDHDDGHGDHTAYDDQSLRRAVFEGVDPAGDPLDSNMPRWSMSDRDWLDLLAYLRSH